MGAFSGGKLSFTVFPGRGGGRTSDGSLSSHLVAGFAGQLRKAREEGVQVLLRQRLASCMGKRAVRLSLGCAFAQRKYGWPGLDYSWLRFRLQVGWIQMQALRFLPGQAVYRRRDNCATAGAAREQPQRSSTGP